MLNTASALAANGGDDKYAPNTGDGNDWEADDVIFQTKIGATVFSRKIDINDPGNPDAVDWDDDTFDWANAKPVIVINGQWSAMPHRVEMGVHTAGDVNTDGTVDFTGDISVALDNYTNTDVALQHGDVNQDGTVDFTGDISVMLDNYTDVATDNPPGAGDMELVIDITDGHVYLVANSATNISGFEFGSPGEQCWDGNYTPTGVFAIDVVEAGGGTEFSFSGENINGTYSLGLIWGGGMDWEFGWGWHEGATVGPGTTHVITYIPEPASASVLFLGAVALLRRRKK